MLIFEAFSSAFQDWYSLFLTSVLSGSSHVVFSVPCFVDPKSLKLVLGLGVGGGGGELIRLYQVFVFNLTKRCRLF